jgi:hypothetical protein
MDFGYTLRGVLWRGKQKIASKQLGVLRFASKRTRQLRIPFCLDCSGFHPFYGKGGVMKKENCSVTVYPTDRFGSFHGYQCHKKATVEREGKKYCKIHDPVIVQQRREERYKKWDADNKISQEKFRRTQAMIKACEDVPTEVLEKIKIKDLI